MSYNDLWVRDIITRYGFVTVLFFSVIIWIIQRYSTIRKSIYKSYLIGFEAECAELASPYKKHLFEQLQHIISNDKILQSMGCIRVLEIGVKTGENIQFYPDGTHLIGVDWNLKLGEYLVKGNRSWQFSHVIIERLIVGDEGSIKDIPTGCVDVVVTTRSLCSVTSIQAALREIRRVLTPGGRYLFMEHIPESKNTFIRWLQKTLSRTGIWPSLFGGCHLDIDPTLDIENAGFNKVTWTPLTLEGYVSQPIHLLLSRQHVFGVAIR